MPGALRVVHMSLSHVSEPLAPCFVRKGDTLNLHRFEVAIGFIESHHLHDRVSQDRTAYWIRYRTEFGGGPRI